MLELTPRQQRALERFQEDEGLTADLNDDQAAVMIQWASEQAIAAAAPERSDAELDLLMQRIRIVVRQVAREHAHDSEPQQLVRHAAQLLVHEVTPRDPLTLNAANVTLPPSMRLRRISLTSYRVV